MGIRQKNMDPYKDLDADETALVKSLNIYPTKSIIAESDWIKITSFYKQNAPDTIENSNQYLNWSKIDDKFSITPITLGEGKYPMISMLKYDSLKNVLYIGDANKELVIIDKNLQLQGYWMLNSPPSDMLFRNNRAPRLLCIGSITPTEKKNGVLFTLDSIISDLTDDQPKTELARPVHISSSDLDGDNLLDEVICEFGHHSGKLSIYLSSKGKKILKLAPGSRKTILTDMDNDGKIDLVFLMAQARESISWFKNMGDGNFTENILLNFHPLFGASNIELVDMNNDGYKDIILSNGDNWDLSPIRKLYHGIRIYLNDKKNNFSLASYFPLYGVSKAIPFDFDQDGDLDIAAVSFYDDPEDPSTSFVILINDNKLHFTPSYLPSLPIGKWLTMDIGDIDQDGDLDIFLGSYFHNGVEITKSAIKGVSEFPHLVILYNKTK